MLVSVYMELQVGVKVLLKNNQGKYLLIRRNPKKYPEVGPKWDIVGGRINPGSPLLENLAREVKEETGMELIGTPRVVGAQDIFNPKFSDRHVVRISYIGEATGTPIIDEESLEWNWFSKEEILALTQSELDRYFLELLEKENVTL
jgi:ADP-ribose pyrophosphatase YjhB (NUDIX family)